MERQRLHDLIYMWNLKKDELIEVQSTAVINGWGQRMRSKQMENFWVKGYKISGGWEAYVLRSFVQQGDFNQWLLYVSKQLKE